MRVLIRVRYLLTSLHLLLLIVAVLKTLLTPILLDFLIMEGYEYCISEKDQLDVGGRNVSIILTPVKSSSINNALNTNIDGCLNIKSMMPVIENTEDLLVMVEIDSKDIERYVGFFMDKLTMNKPVFNLNIQEEC
jgi:hypothetical protein